MGVIALFVAVLPRLAIGGREIFFAEASGPDDEKVAPQIRRTASLLWRLYAALTRAADHRAGDDRHAAVRLGLQHLRHDRRRRFLAAPAVDCRLPEPGRGVGDHRVHVPGRRELRAAVPRAGAGATGASSPTTKSCAPTPASSSIATIVLAITIRASVGSGDLFRTALFQVLSIITTTGFASVDFQLWNDQAKAVLLGLMFIGGCAGSAGGGPKVVRHLLLARFTLQELRRTPASARDSSGQARRPRRARARSCRA